MKSGRDTDIKALSTIKKATYAVTALLVITKTVSADNYQIICKNEGLCSGELCVAKLTDANKTCKQECGSNARVTSYVYPSKCTLPGSSTTESWKPLPWQVEYCRQEPSHEEKRKMISVDTSSVHHVEPRTRRTICLSIPPSQISHKVFCWASDAYGSGPCIQGVGSNTRCSIDWSWPLSTPSRIDANGNAELCVQFYNESHNRWRNFGIGAVLQPR
jgi:hypothetical protein